MLSLRSGGASRGRVRAPSEEKAVPPLRVQVARRTGLSARFVLQLSDAWTSEQRLSVRPRIWTRRAGFMLSQMRKVRARRRGLRLQV